MSDLSFDSIAEMLEFLDSTASGSFPELFEGYLESSHQVFDEFSDDMPIRYEFKDGSAIIMERVGKKFRFSMGIHNNKIDRMSKGEKEPMLYATKHIISEA